MNVRLVVLSLAAALTAAHNPVLAAVDAPSPAAPNAAAVALGDAAPSFTAHRLSDRRLVTNADYKGKILVLNFWATWCPPCRRETPDMIAAFHKLGGGDVAFLGVDTTEVPSVVKTFVSAKGLPYPIALAGPETYNGFGVAYIPTTIVIDGKGIIRARWTGELDPKRLGDFVADARAAKNYTLDTPDQTLVDRLLDPEAYDIGTTADRYA
ncbi:MAG: TlpA family protein disulfide reductase, partial [Candidatus Eremiobacteraeota bacterium]|nr:TlpA family protein disulfide reductase [Candidatus Eremiobacteraeota bacterium]